MILTPSLTSHFIRGSRSNLTAPYYISSKKAYVLNVKILKNLNVREDVWVSYGNNYSTSYDHQTARQVQTPLAQNPPITYEGLWRNLQMAVKRTELQGVWKVNGGRIRDKNLWIISYSVWCCWNYTKCAKQWESSLNGGLGSARNRWRDDRRDIADRRVKFFLHFRLYIIYFGAYLKKFLSMIIILGVFGQNTPNDKA